MTESENGEDKIMKRVAKFGGSSLATAERLSQVELIIGGDKSRQFIVPSAPGKERLEDVKATDLNRAISAIHEEFQDS